MAKANPDIHTILRQDDANEELEKVTLQREYSLRYRRVIKLQDHNPEDFNEEIKNQLQNRIETAKERATQIRTKLSDLSMTNAELAALDEVVEHRFLHPHGCADPVCSFCLQHVNLVAKIDELTRQVES